MEQQHNNNNNNNNGSRSSTGIEDPAFGSPGDSTNDRCWPEAGGSRRELRSPRSRSRSNSDTAATSVVEDQEGSAFHLDTGEGSDTFPAEQREKTVTVEKAQTTRTRRNDGEGTSDATDGGHARTRDDRGVVQALARDDTRKDPAGAVEHDGSEDGGHVVTGPAVGAFASDGDGWVEADRDEEKGAPFQSRQLEATPATTAGDAIRSSDEQPPSRGRQRQSLDRTPRVVIVSVKPKRSQQPVSASASASASAQEKDNTSASSPQRPGFRAGNTSSIISDTDLFRGNDGVDSGEASPISPGFSAEPTQTSPMPAEKRKNVDFSSGGGGASTAGAFIGRVGVSSGARDGGPTSVIPGPSAPLAAASQLGLDGDGFPDVAEFDLDDISEIDAGGEWAGSEGGSLSS